MGLARAADLPVLLVGDIDRGGVFASLLGTLALLEPEDQALIAGFVINKFRGDPSILAPGLEQLAALTGRPTLGVLPWLDGPFIDAEDSLALRSARADARGTLDVAVIRLRWMSNFTDVDALAAEPGVSRALHALARPTSSAPTSSSCPARRPPSRTSSGCAPTASTARCTARSGPILGICGGYQMLGDRDRGRRRVAPGSVDGPRPAAASPRRFAREKLLRQVDRHRAGASTATGYEIRHGRVDRDEPLLAAAATSSAPPGTACSRATRSAARCSPGSRERTRPRLDARHDAVRRRARGAPRPARRLVRRARRRAPRSSTSSNGAPRTGCPTIPPGGAACSVF